MGNEIESRRDDRGSHTYSSAPRLDAPPMGEVAMPPQPRPKSLLYQDLDIFQLLFAHSEIVTEFVDDRPPDLLA